LGGVAVSRWRKILDLFGYGAGGRALTTTGPDDRAPGQPIVEASVHERGFFDDRPPEVRYTYIGGPVRFVGRPNAACTRCWPGDGHDHHCHERPCYRVVHRCLCGAEITDPPPVRGRFVGEPGPELTEIPPGAHVRDRLGEWPNP
jgi:hypothetical protein